MILTKRMTIPTAAIATLALSVLPVKAQWVQTGGPEGGIIKALCVTDSNIFAGTYGNGVFLSTNNGRNWTPVNNGLTNLDIRSFIESGNNIFAGTWGGGVFFSTDDGTNWAAANSGLIGHSILSLATSGNNIFMGTWGGGVFLSTNNGTSWAAVNSGLTNRVIYSLATTSNNIFTGTIGSVWRRPLSDVTKTTDIPACTLAYSDGFKIFFPSPLGSKASIAFSLPRRERVKFTLYNLSGNAMRTLADKQFEAGPQTLFWDTRSLAPGCYTVKMRAGTNTSVKYFAFW
jgi:hypothetical protein